MSPDLSPIHTSPIPGPPLHPSPSPYGSSPTAPSHVSASNSQPGSVPFNNNNVGEPPAKVVPDISFDDLSASFRSLYRSMFDSSGNSHQSFAGMLSPIFTSLSLYIDYQIGLFRSTAHSAREKLGFYFQ